MWQVFCNRGKGNMAVVLPGNSVYNIVEGNAIPFAGMDCVLRHLVQSGCFEMNGIVK